MNACIISIFFPNAEIRLTLDPLNTVESNDIELRNRLVELRRVTCCNNYPTCRNLMKSENLILQELEHCRSKGLGNAVDLIEEENTLFDASGFDSVIKCSHDLTHRVLGYLHVSTGVVSMYNNRKTEGRLSCVVGHRVGNKVYASFLSYLLHDSGLTDTRCAKQEHRSLMFYADSVIAKFVFNEIGLYRIKYLLFCVFNIHSHFSSVQSEAVNKKHCTIK